MAHLTTDLDDAAAVPYFLWNEPTTVAELRRILADRSHPARSVYLARMMREARVRELWKFVSLRDVVEAYPQVRPHLGRRRRFWDFLLERWQALGLI